MLILIQLNRVMENQKDRVGGGGMGGEEETSIDFNTDYWNISHCHQQSNSNSTDLDGHIPPTCDCPRGNHRLRKKHII